MKKEVLLIISFLFLINLISAVSMPIYVKPLSGDGSLNPNTAYIYTFNWTTDSSCNNVVFSNSSLTITTGNDGIGFINLTIPDSLSSIPSYICEYRSGALRKVHTLSSQFFDKVYVQSINATGNITADYGLFSYLGNLANKITKLFVTDINAGGSVDVGGDLNVTGTSYFTDTNFNGGWMNDGLSIINGDIYAQTGYFYNITSLNVTEQNLTVLDDLIIYGNTFLSKNLIVDTDTLFVDSNTNMVGIGTDSPGSKLEVKGSDIKILVNGSAASAFQMMETSGNITWSEWQQYDDKLRLNVHNGSQTLTNIITVESTGGNVGIETTSPGSKVEIAGSNHRLAITDSGDSYNARAYLGEISALGGYLQLFNETESTTVLIRSYASDGTQAYFTAGNVGIGTTSPDQKLEVIGISQFTAIDGAGDYMTIQPFTDGVTYFNAYGAGAGEGGFDFRVNDGGTHALWIDKGGNVGIGDTTPTEGTLTVGGTGYFTGTVVVGTPTSNSHATTKEYVDGKVVTGTYTRAFIDSATSCNSGWTRKVYGTGCNLQILDEEIFCCEPGSILCYSRKGNNLYSSITSALIYEDGWCDNLQDWSLCCR